MIGVAYEKENSGSSWSGVAHGMRNESEKVLKKSQLSCMSQGFTLVA
jgi:hypothetical protein